MSDRGSAVSGEFLELACGEEADPLAIGGEDDVGAVVRDREDCQCGQCERGDEIGEA
jgi:hypothetical protein